MPRPHADTGGRRPVAPVAGRIRITATELPERAAADFSLELRLAESRHLGETDELLACQLQVGSGEVGTADCSGQPLRGEPDGQTARVW